MADALDVRSLWDFGDPKLTEERFDALLAEVLTQKARSQGLQRRFEDARNTLEQAKGLLKPDFVRATISYFLELGRVENSSGNRDAARPHFLYALEIAENAGNEEFLAIDAAHMLGIVEGPAKALDWNQRAIAMAEKATEQKARNWLGSLYNNTGWTLYEMGEYEKALDLFERALAFRKEEGIAGKILIADYCVGKCLRALGKVDDALAIQLRLEKEADEVGQDGFIYEEIAECLLLKGDPRAAGYFGKAYDLLSKDAWLMDSEPDRVERLKECSNRSVQTL